MRSRIPWFLSCVLVWHPAISQIPDRHLQDTVQLARREYVQYHTDNGSGCICSVRNPDGKNRGILVITGAPDSLMFNNCTLFNGIHVLEPNEQLIAAGNFKGKEITFLNLTVRPVTVVILVFCPR